MRYSIDHLTHYAYTQPVGLSFQIAHLRPRDGAGQRCLAHTLEIEPRPAAQHEDSDYFGNGVVRFELSSPHEQLQVRARSVVERAHRDTHLPASPPWERVQAHFAQPQWGLDASSAASEFLFPSSNVPFSPALRQLALQDFVPGAPILAAAAALMARIHTEFEFDPDATHVATPIERVLAMRRGVCQDFAQLMIGCLRALGLPARYMSGYLLTEPPPGQPRLEGADASHAWVALFVPALGWFEFDPTNNVVPSDAHITLAWGRDFADVSPLRGVILGGGEHEVSVAVTVRPLEDATAD